MYHKEIFKKYIYDPQNNSKIECHGRFFIIKNNINFNSLLLPYALNKTKIRTEHYPRCGSGCSFMHTSDQDIP